MWCSGAKSQLDLEPLVCHYGHSILARIVASSILAVEVTLLNERRKRSIATGISAQTLTGWVIPYSFQVPSRDDP